MCFPANYANGVWGTTDDETENQIEIATELTTLSKPYTFLLVADDPTTRDFIQTAIEQVFKTCFFQVVEDGIEAMYYLTGYDRYADRAHYPLPVLILTELNVSWLSGLQLLAWVKQQSGLQNISVVIISHSEAKPQVKKARDLGASYFVKTSPIEHLIYLVETLLARTA